MTVTADPTPGIRLGDVVLRDRARRDLGDVSDLAESIRSLGLLHPIVITEDNVLVAGHRRLEACRSLGWEAIPCRVAEDIGDAVMLLRAERDENVCRKDMTPAEKIALGEAIAALERPKAKERQGTRTDLGHELPVRANGKCDPRDLRDTREVVAAAVGMSTATYSRARRLVAAASDPDLDPERRAAAQEAVAEMERTGKVTPAFEKFQGRPVGSRTKNTSAPESAKGAVRQLPKPTERPEHLRKTHRHDSNRIVEQTVMGAEGLCLGLDLIDFEALDKSQLEAWSSSLRQSIRSLNRLVKELDQHGRE